MILSEETVFQQAEVREYGIADPENRMIRVMLQADNGIFRTRNSIRNCFRHFLFSGRLNMSAGVASAIFISIVGNREFLLHSCPGIRIAYRQLHIYAAAEVI